MIEKVEDIKRPLIVGEVLNVLCIITKSDNGEELYVTPVINHPHTDKESGQFETHYHTDTRFVFKKRNRIGIRLRGGRIFKDCDGYRQTLDKYRTLERIALTVRRSIEEAPTHESIISKAKSKLKNKCIKNGKCPHRGYDLSQVEPTPEGVLICPLHSLKFNAVTKRLIEE